MINRLSLLVINSTPQIQGFFMLDEKLVHHVKRHGELYDAVALMSRKTNCGAIKELAYSRYDNCFYVTVNGRERFRGDSPNTVYGYFCSAAPN